MPFLSVVVITLNEERRIATCLDSVKDIADEIVVVDSGSTDNTESICRRFGVRWIHQPFLGYIEQKNFASAQATHDWVLSLDADEALDETLTASVKSIMMQPEADGYTMNRLTNYCGHWVRHGGWYPDRKLRLYKHKLGAWTGVNPHDRYELRKGSKVGWLQGDILHYSYDTISDHIRQIDRFSSIGAQALYKKGKRITVIMIPVKAFVRFFRNYIIKGGFRDGLTGFTIALNSAHAVFLKYLRLYYLQKGRSL